MTARDEQKGTTLPKRKKKATRNRSMRKTSANSVAAGVDVAQAPGGTYAIGSSVATPSVTVMPLGNMAT